MGKNAELEKARAQGKYMKPFETDILKLRADELNYTLCMFVKEVRKPNGEPYASDSILYLTLGIQGEFKKIYRYFVSKIILTYWKKVLVIKNKVIKFEAEGQEFEQFIRTVKGQNNFNLNLLLEAPIRSNTYIGSKWNK